MVNGFENKCSLSIYFSYFIFSKDFFSFIFNILKSKYCMSLLNAPNEHCTISVNLKPYQVNSQLGCYCHRSYLINISFSGIVRSRCSRNAIPFNFSLRISLCVPSLPSSFRGPWKQKHWLNSNRRVSWY